MRKKAHDEDHKPFQVTFNGFPKVEFQGSRVTSGGGLSLVRERDERVGLGRLIKEHPTDSRQGSNKKFPLADLLQQSVDSRLAGYEDLNDSVRISSDATFRLIGSNRNRDHGGALTSRLQSLVTALTVSDKNLTGLLAVKRELAARTPECRSYVISSGRYKIKSPRR